MMGWVVFAFIAGAVVFGIWACIVVGSRSDGQ